MTQILLDRGLGAAGVAIDSAPVKGILVLPFSTLRVAFPALSNPANNHRATGLTAEQFHYAFANTLSEEESNTIYERYAVPGPDHMLFQASFANFNPHAATTVNFANDTRAPLLLVAGGKDHISPASVTKANYKLYSKSRAVTEYKEYPGSPALHDRTGGVGGSGGLRARLVDAAREGAADGGLRGRADAHGRSRDACVIGAGSVGAMIDPPEVPGVVHLPSERRANDTADRLAELAQSEGSHGVRAHSSSPATRARRDSTLRPMIQLVFGNPRAGTPLLAANPAVGIGASAARARVGRRRRS